MHYLEKTLNAVITTWCVGMVCLLLVAANEVPPSERFIPVPAKFNRVANKTTAPKPRTALAKWLAASKQPRYRYAAADTDTVRVPAPKPTLPSETKPTPTQNPAIPLPPVPKPGSGSRPEDEGMPKPVVADTVRKPVAKDSLKTVAPNDSTKAALVDSFKLSQEYFTSKLPRYQYVSPYTFKRSRPMMPTIGSSYWTREVKLDSTSNSYYIRDLVGGKEVRYPIRADMATYLKAKRGEVIQNQFRSISDQRSLRRDAQRGGAFSYIFQIPGGENSAFSTIFGKPEVNLRVTGQADIDAGFSKQVTDDPSVINQTRLDPTFAQNIRLGVGGTIGDKLFIDVNWDTQRQFDYENQIKLRYKGYEDEIIKNIEAGNVTLNSRSSLINGGRSLFGVRTDLKLGGVDVTLVASQQKGNGSELELDGGSEKQEYKVQPFDYEDNTHYFMGFYFRNNWERALQEPTRITTNVERMSRIEVWKLVIQQNPDQTDLRNVVAVPDLGEIRGVLSNPDLGGDKLPAPNGGDQYDDAIIDKLRQGSTEVGKVLDNPNTYTVGRFRLLKRDRDYVVNEQLGYITMTSKLSPNEALAVAYEYIDTRGNAVQVGDLTGSGSSSVGGINDDRLVLKLLRRPNPVPKDVTWFLTMRNIYRLPANNVSPENFELVIRYEKPGSRASEDLPNVSISKSPTLIQLLGLDRLGTGGSVQPDNQVDLDSYVFDNRTGRLIFPYLQPFGKRLEDVLSGKDAKYKATFQGTTLQDALNEFVLDTLYVAEPAIVRNISQLDIYKIAGSAKGAVQSSYNLGFGIVPNSVRVYSNGNELSPSDYIVNYDFGNLEIINPAYLAPGNKIKVSYERNQLFSIQQKSLLGVRAEYNLRDRLMLGATAMRLTEKPNTDKFRLGQEPIANSIWGLDGQYQLEPRWLTRAIDALPLIQTRAPSQIQLRGEFAQLRPRSTQTQAFVKTTNELKDLNKDRSQEGLVPYSFAEDEKNGEISYIDDFEGLKTKYSLAQSGIWRISSPPDSIAKVSSRDVNGDSLLATYRGRMGWFNIGREIYAGSNGLANQPKTGPASVVAIKTVFPNFDDSNLNAQDRFLTTFNIFFDPTDRGPYNYSTDLDRFLTPTKRQDLWGGMIQRLPEGVNNFTTQNIEFIEFIVSPYTQNSGRNAKLLINVGAISEDILPNGKFNTEDGLSLKDPIADQDVYDGWGRLGGQNINSITDVEKDAQRRTEDLGLDGISSYDGVPGGKYSNLYRTKTGAILTEQNYFKGYLDAINPAASKSPLAQSVEYKALYDKIVKDPSGDDYHDFRDDAYFGADAAVEKRFYHHFSGQELNSPQAQRDILGNSLGSNKSPDSEDLDLNNNLNVSNNYYEYEIPLDPARLDALANPDSTNDYIVNKTSGDVSNGEPAWYLVRIPVRNYTRKVGDINGFNQMQSIRVWTTGHAETAAIRFASFDLVGSQWRSSPQIGAKTATNTVLSITSVNSEENADVYRTPPTAIVNEIRDPTRGTTRKGREQAMAITIKDLKAGDQRAVYKTYNEGLDLLKYENVRMFAHLHGLDAVGRTLKKETFNRENLKMFVRLGSDEVKDYYEYELPLTPTELKKDPNADELWQIFQKAADGSSTDLNSMHIITNHLNKLKSLRDDSLSAGRKSASLDSVFWHTNSGLEETLLPNALDYLNQIGAKLGIKGNPSLSKITNIVIGVRNTTTPIRPDGSLPAGQGEPFQELTLWVNELRVTGYDSQSGYAWLGSATIRLADFATLNANINKRTDGFGSLDSKLGDRQGISSFDWGLTANVNLHKLIPERYGWQIPVTYSIKQGSSTPRFLPDQGDIPYKAKVAEIEETYKDDAQTKQEKLAVLNEQVQTANFTRSLNVPISKSNSDAPVLRYLLDPLALSYRYSANNSHNPQTRIDEGWQWGAAATYSLQMQKPKTVRPFWFVPRTVPVLGSMNRLRFSYLPQSVKASGSLDRNFKSNQQRERKDNRSTATQSIIKPYELANPFRQNHDMGARRTFDISYNPFTFLALTYRNETSQTFVNGLDSLFTLYQKANNAFTSTGKTFASTQDYRAYINELIEANNKLTKDDFETTGLLTPRPFQNVALAIWNDRANPIGVSNTRTDRHAQDFTATLDPKLDQIKALDWLRVQAITYGANFDWSNGDRIGENERLGSNISVQSNIRGGLNFQLASLYKKSKGYQKIEEEQRQKDQAKQQRVQQRQREKDQAKQQAKAIAEAERRDAEMRERLRREAEGDKPDSTSAAKPENAAKPARSGRLGRLGGRRNQDEQVKPKTDANAKPDSTKTQDAANTAKPENGKPKTKPKRQRTGIFALLDRRKKPKATTDSTATKSDSTQATTKPNGKPDAKTDAKTDSTKKGGSFIPRAVVRRTVLLATSLQDLGINYTGTFSTGASNVEGGYYLFDKTAPALAYRFGFQKNPEVDRVRNNSLQISDQARVNHRIDIRGRLALIKDFSIDLGSNFDFNDQTKTTYRENQADPDILESFLSSNGTTRTSVWGLTGSFENMLRSQMVRFNDILETRVGDTLFVSNKQLGALTNESVINDFRSAFIGLGSSALDTRGFIPVPLPGWRISYSGLQKIPIFLRLFQSATIGHGYDASYEVDYRSNTNPGKAAVLSLPDPNNPTRKVYERYETPTNEVNSIRINERYSPLVEMRLTWKFGMQTEGNWIKSNSYAFNSTNFDVNINRTNEFKFTNSYTLQRITLPLQLFGGKPLRIDSGVRLSLSANYRKNGEYTYSLRKSLEEVIVKKLTLADLKDPEKFVLDTSVPPRASQTLDFEFRAGLNLSSRFGVDLFYNRSQRLSEGKIEPNLTTSKAGASMRVNIAN